MHRLDWRKSNYRALPVKLQFLSIPRMTFVAIATVQNHSELLNVSYFVSCFVLVFLGLELLNIALSSIAVACFHVIVKKILNPSLLQLIGLDIELPPSYLLYYTVHTSANLNYISIFQNLFFGEQTLLCSHRISSTWKREYKSHWAILFATSEFGSRVNMLVIIQACSTGRGCWGGQKTPFGSETWQRSTLGDQFTAYSACSVCEHLFCCIFDKRVHLKASQFSKVLWGRDPRSPVEQVGTKTQFALLHIGQKGLFFQFVITP